MRVEKSGELAGSAAFLLSSAYQQALYSPHRYMKDCRLAISSGYSRNEIGHSGT